MSAERGRNMGSLQEAFGIRFRYTVVRKCEENTGTSGNSSGVSPLLAGSTAGGVAGRGGGTVAAPNMPDAALTDLFDHVRQSIGGVVPVRLDGALRAARVALGDGRGDRVVL